MFKINSVFRIDAATVRVLVEVDAKHWNACKAKGQLGALYGIDISNAVFQLHQVKAHNPTVSDRLRAVRVGTITLKTLILDYADSEWAPVPDNIVRVDFKARKRVA